MIDEVHGNSYASEPIAFEMDDGDIREIIRPYIMGRIVDVEQFLRRYPCEPEEPGVCFAFEVEDAFLPWNNGRFTVLFQQGKTTLVQRRADFHVKLSIVTLSALLMGYKTAAKLHRLGRIEAEPRSIARSDNALLQETPYIPDYI